MKDERYMHVSRVSQHNAISPYIRLRGKWLEEAGFDIGASIKVGVEHGKLTITPDNRNNSRFEENQAAQKSKSLEDIIEKPSLPKKKKASMYGQDYRGYTVQLRLERDTNYEPIKLLSAKDVFHFLRPLQYKSREVMLSIMLDTYGQVLGVYEVGKGSMKGVGACPMEALKSALMANSPDIILAHNHPSGITEPSEYDINATKNLVMASKPMGITVLDHVIIGFNNYTSLKDLGYL